MASVRVLIPVLAVLLLSACLSNSGGSSDPGNITADAVSVVTADPSIANPMKATISLTADQAKSEVPVSLYAIDKTDDPSVEARQIPLGTVVVKKVSAGTHDYDLDVTVPASVEKAGSYYLSAVVDEASVINESSKDDNTAATEMALADTRGPNILLADVTLDHSALVINTDEYVTPTADNTYNADAGGTITVGADGLALGENIDIDAFASLRMHRSDTDTSLDMPLYLWKSDEGRYTKAYGIDPVTDPRVVSQDPEWLPMGQFTPLLAEMSGDEASLDDVRRNSEHMEFYFPGKLGYELNKALRYAPCEICVKDATLPPPDLSYADISRLNTFLNGLPFSGITGDESAGMAVLDFAICVKIRPTDPMVSDSSADDNEVCKPIDISLPPLTDTPSYDIGSYETAPLAHSMVVTPTLPPSSSDGYATKNSNPYFAFNLDFGAGSTTDDRGYIAEATAGVPVKVFGKGFDFMRLTVRAQLVPDYYNKPAAEESGFSSEIRFLGMVIDTLGPTTVYVSSDSSSSSESKINYSKEVEKEQQFFVGPVPLIAGASIGGNIGLFYGFGYADDAAPFLGSGNAVVSLGASIGPFANLEAGLSIGVGTKVFNAGVEGVLTLLDERLIFSIGPDIEVIDDGFSSHDVEFIISQGPKLTNIFTGPQGALNLYVKYTTAKWTTCKVGIIKYKCIKIGQMKRIKNLYTTPALFKREDVLVEGSKPKLDVVKLNGKQTAYYNF